MSNHVQQHEDPTLRFTWTLSDDGGATVIAFRRDDEYGARSEKFVVDDVEDLAESIADIVREDGRVQGEYPLGWQVPSDP